MIAALIVINGCGPEKRTFGGPDASDNPDLECITTDEPDALGTDSNCDGVDGDLADSVFVDGNLGNDANLGSREAPVATISRGIDRAEAQGKRAVLVSAGVYVEQLSLVSGVSVHGGYAAWDRWSRGSLVELKTTVTSSTSPVVLGESITTHTRITGLRIAATEALDYGLSSMAVRLLGSSAVVFEDCELVADDGAPGANADANPGFGAAGNDGAAGSAAKQAAAACDTLTACVVGRTSGASGACSCAAGGYGGGAELTTWTGTPELRVGSGQGGEHLGGEPATCARVTGVGTTPGSGGPATSTTDGTGRQGALGATGIAGLPGEWSTAFAEGGFVPSTGGLGGTGGPGGGGGGGAAGAFVNCVDGPPLIGSGGGAGGSGGCGGQGGQGGQGGGASIALFLSQSTPTLVRTVLRTGDGGGGGVGAIGGDGGGGGEPGAPGPSTVTCPGTSTKARSGGSGARGGAGGRGGTGGGGAGGVSIAVALGGESSIAADSVDYFAQVGAPGAGGPGGNEGVVGVACARYDVATSTCGDF